MARVPVATDNFNRSNGSIGANYTVITAGSPVVNSNRCEHSASGGDDEIAYWSANSFDADQYSLAKITSVSSQSYTKLFVRYQPLGGARVMVEKRYENTDFRIWWYDGDDWTQLGSKYSGGWSVNDIIAMEAEGDDVRVYQNGNLRISATNASIPEDGYPGFGFADQADDSIDDWEGGDLVSTTDLSISEAESITVSETKSLVTSDPSINKSESVSVADTPVVNITTAISESESITVTESITLTDFTRFISSAEAISVTDTPLLTVAVPLINVSEAIAVADSVVASLITGDLSISKAETVTLYEYPYVQDPSNLLYNGSFDLDALSEFPLGWTDYSSYGTPVFKAVDNEFVSDGTQSFKIYTVGSSDFGIKQQLTGLTIGMRYTLRSWIKTDATVTRALIALDTTQDGAGGSLTEVTAVADSVEGYYTVSLIADSTTLNVFLGMGGFEGGGSEGTVWWDELSVIASEVDTHTINKSESITVVDATLGSVSIPGISVSESIALTESQGITPSTPPLQVSDSVGVTDSPTLTVADPQISVAETVNVSENAFPDLGLAFYISETETITVVDTPTIASLSLGISVSDIIAIDEFVETLQPDLVISAYQLVTVLSSVSFSFDNRISVEDNISVTDSSSSFKHVRNKSVIAGIKPTRVGVNIKPNKPEFVVGQSQHGHAPIKGDL